ncbi:General amino acid permease AGP2 [Colletotrichum fructicola]|uniref:General amino acid permease AGP2 n=1 Tax=Colletotrichum fructicola (strain Nara gc5) TaxID=1213859 RepID=L2FTM7_COLFN|nr:General amino acid permease [Colletotrichum fructicola]KAF4476231.1 General amino acid permease AGP2 [Colletotrichum fructicola Nara gc5]KAE9567699.1 General amino acid permease [Colletotrichum fructicola]KAF4424421.1 General amino acid permease AGP2 [Colletotrichum fructicola]KAF4886764.1 General amino acid permease AGP2 [Colletotrichum fructicola]KAF4897533.1 General amino acid permease AGP2 [Colletotrichum fructicola]
MDTGNDEKKLATTPTPSIYEGQALQQQQNGGLHRRVGGRQIQLFTIGGSIGTALFISIGTALFKAGPGSLLLSFFAYCCVIALVNNCIAEMTVLMPVSGGFVRLACNWVDEALGFAAGINFFLYEAISIPFEITALNSILKFWRDDTPVAAVCAACIVIYAALNLSAVKYYSESEFWLSSGKVILIIILTCFTFVTMVGGNPQHDAYGFRYWKDPGAFAEWRSTGNLGRFEGFLAALFFAPLPIVGPEYISMIAGEAIRPRVNIKKAFKTTYYRLAYFFLGGAICVGIVVPHNDPTLRAIVNGEKESGSGAASPYVIAMTNLGVEVLPHLVNALILSSVFAAGNTYVYCASRNLYGLALDGYIPKVMTRCTKSGVPIYCLGVTLVFPCLSLLQLSNSGATVLDWLVNILTSGGLVNFIVMCIVYLRFYKACEDQGVDRTTLPYRAWFQPYSAWIALFMFCSIAICSGYTTFIGDFSAATFFTRYTMVLFAPVSYCGWKLIKRTRIIPAKEVDLVWERPEIDAYEASLEEEKSSVVSAVINMLLGGWKKGDEKDRESQG